MIVLCPKCGSTRLIRVRSGADGAVKLRCPKCRHTLTAAEQKRGR